MLFNYFPSKKGKFLKRATDSKRGFSLIELIVVVTIFGIITAIVLVGHSKFRGTILLGNLAYDVALSVRQAQSFGLGVRGFGTGPDSFNVAYGIHLDSGSNNSYILFADLDRSGEFESMSDEIVQTFKLERSYSISFCGVFSGGGENCGLSSLDIVFDRPEPDALFLSNPVGTYSLVRITVRSPAGEERDITVTVTGQISVEQPLPQ